VALTRRTLLAAAALTGATAAGAGAVELTGRRSAAAPVPLGAQPPGLPAAQHAWEASLARDREGNHVAPRYDRLLMFDLAGPPTTATAARLEAAMRTLERTYPWSPAGLLFVLGWGPHYFRTWLQTASPVPEPTALSSFELPHLDAYDVCLHLAADDPHRLAAVEAALVHGRGLPGARGTLDLRGALTWRETRTGFSGAGLPARHQHVGGIPPGGVVRAGAPLFMGFKSALRRNQASERAVTIADGAMAGGTTMHVSRMRLALDSWYGLLDERQRVARMYAPEVTPGQVHRFTTDARSDPAAFATAARRYGVVGHAQASARARVHGRPRILRRDFNTVDGGEAGLHFVSLQRTIADFVATRRAMNAARAPYLNPAITPTVNNGINDFIFVLARANYAVPPRAHRSFPLLPGDAHV
jgi:dye decolorizing peroxidase